MTKRFDDVISSVLKGETSQQSEAHDIMGNSSIGNCGNANGLRIERLADESNHGGIQIRMRPRA